MPTARRYDAAQIAPKGIRRDSRGFVEVDAFVTRTGVLTYRRADGTVVRELRHPDHVFRADSLATLRGAPVTIGHPGQGQTWVDPANAHEHEVGIVSSATAELDQYVGSQLSVRRADAIKRIDSKELVEVSAAYDCEVDPTPGTYQGQPYDQVQTGITYNHVALLAAGKGRCGRDVKLRVDSADAEIVDTNGGLNDRSNDSPNGGSNDKEGERMSTRKLRVDGVEYELPDSAASVLEKAVQDRDANKKRADQAEAERDMAKSELAKAQDAKTVNQLVQARVTLERQAASVLGAEKRFDSLTDRDVRVEVLKVTNPDYKVEGRSDDAVSAAFDYALQTASKTNQGLKLVSLGLAHGDEQGGEKRADQGQSEVEKRLKDLEDKRLNAAAGLKKGA